MNKRQKQVQQSLLNSEIDVLNALEESYQKALNDINGVIAKLLARKDTENLQAIIYQLKYQRLLKSEIEGFLNALHTQNYQLIDDYLKDSYITAHIGTLFDLQGQGVPLILPLNQEQMISAITLNSKLSEPLYNSLGYDVEHLKINVVSEISRGIAQRLSYAEMARNLSAKTKLPMKRTLNIARTEGHRIQQEATYNLQIRAKEKKYAPHFEFNKLDSYAFYTPNDTGTGARFKGVCLLDLAILDGTKLPAIAHDSIMFTNIEDQTAIDIVKIYSTKTTKQIFVCIEKPSRYNEKNDDGSIVNIAIANKCIQLGENGKALFGRQRDKVEENPE